MSIPGDVKVSTAKYSDSSDTIQVLFGGRARLRMLICRGRNYIFQAFDNSCTTVAICDGGSEEAGSEFVRYKFNLAYSRDESSGAFRAFHKMAIINMGAHGIIFDTNITVDFGSLEANLGDFACTQLVTLVYS